MTSRLPTVARLETQVNAVLPNISGCCDCGNAMPSNWIAESKMLGMRVLFRSAAIKKTYYSVARHDLLTWIRCRATVGAPIAGALTWWAGFLAIVEGVHGTPRGRCHLV